MFRRPLILGGSYTLTKMEQDLRSNQDAERQGWIAKEMGHRVSQPALLAVAHGSRNPAADVFSSDRLNGIVDDNLQYIPETCSSKEEYEGT